MASSGEAVSRGNSRRFETLRVPKAAELVARDIRRRIVHGELKEDDALPTESDLMEEFGVSRPTLREALRILEAESLISVRRGSRGGARVRIPQPSVAADYTGLLLQINDTTVEDVLEARLALEVGAVRALAEMANKDLAALRQIHEREGEVLDDFMSFRACAHEIHHGLVRATRNQSLMLLYDLLGDITDRHISAVSAAQNSHPRSRPAWRTKSHDVHGEIIDLVDAGNSEKAEHLWRAHVRETNKALVKQSSAHKVLDLFQ